MSEMVARTGRHRQRYEDNFRLVSGCIPYRLTNAGDYQRSSLENVIEVLMVSSPNRDDLVFPKGGWEDDETVHEAACREALEEAGVRGVLNETALGIWEFRSKSSCSLEGGCRGYMFALEVTEELEAWPERENRCRKWVNVKDAFELCRYEWMCQALKSFLGLLVEEAKLEIGESPEPSTSPSDVVADSPIVQPNGTCCINVPSSQRLAAVKNALLLVHHCKEASSDLTFAADYISMLACSGRSDP